MTQPPLHRYRVGLHKLIATLGRGHPRITEVQILQHRLTHNLAQTLEHGATPALDAERARILESCDRLSRVLTGTSFYEFCGVSQPTPSPSAPLDAEARERQAALEAYMQRVHVLLTEHGLRTARAGSEVWEEARSRSLSLLETLHADGVRKGQLLQFLYEAGLITEGAGVIFLAEADLQGLHLDAAILVEAHLAGTHLERAHLEGAHLEWTRLGEACLKEAHLRHAYLVAAHLAGASLMNANLEEVCLLGATMSGTNLVGANLSRAHLEWAFLVTANLQNANLAGARLMGAELESANLAHANLIGTDLRETRLTWTRLRGARYNADTRWPEGFDPVAAGAVSVGS
jgi:uncharacterized protein YjbI with pentapeptide repeats